MNYKYVIDNCLDDREFRNVVNTVLIKNGYTSLGFDDERISDAEEINNNDILVKKDNVKYTVQTYLNKEISMKEINEVIKDMEKENVSAGILATNNKVSDELFNIAKENNIEIWDKDRILKSI